LPPKPAKIHSGRTLAADGGLKELVLRWFTDTQAPLILQNGNFPDWFQGLAARKEAEDVLRDKSLGCFLIRLSDKAIGYILSYKGQDRCRHFVISQNPEGQFVIAGDCQLFGSLTQLIEHYKVRPIQPFGEFLTSSCCHVRQNPAFQVFQLNTMSHPSEMPTNPNRAQRHRGRTTPPLPANKDLLHPTDSNNSSDFYKEIVPDADLSQVESRSQSLPYLGNDDEEEKEEEKYSNKFNSLSVTASAPPKKVTCLTYSFHAPGVSQSSFGSEPENGSQDQLRPNPLYQSSEAAAGSPAQQAVSMYAEVPHGPTRTADDTYEQIPGDGAGHSNTYESVEDVKSKKPKSTWGKNVRMEITDSLFALSRCGSVRHFICFYCKAQTTDDTAPFLGLLQVQTAMVPYG
uniref:SH2 domain containing 7 n=1 Tax=Xiphophorus maculatus TaxID=8083 RepID=A0A3B5PY80_XIPMA